MDSLSLAIRRILGVRYSNSIALLLLSLLVLQTHLENVILFVFSQQPYFDNKQLNCTDNSTATEGYACNGPLSSCTSYLTFRSSLPYYSSIPSISYLFSVDPTAVAAANNVSDVSTFPAGHMLLVPVNCSCTSVYTATGADGQRHRHRRLDYYQHNASYVLKNEGETYFSIANITYGGLTTCQAMIAQNPVDSHNLSVGLRLVAPLMCACPSTNQTAKGFRYIVSYVVKTGDDVSFIAQLFGADQQVILDANELSSDSTIYPYNPILVPMKFPPTNLSLNPTMPSPPPPPPPSALPPPPTDGGGSSNNWVFIGVGIGVFLLIFALSLFLFWFFLRHRLSRKPSSFPAKLRDDKSTGYGVVAGVAAAEGETTTSRSQLFSSNGVKSAIESLNVYKIEELQKATGNFGESNRIKGSVFQGYFNGDPAAVKIMKTDVSSEIKILKQINHSNIIRLSGFCIHDGNTYFVYEYAEKGSLQDWLLRGRNEKKSSALGWKQRVQIAYDIADGLNYLHNYTNPPYVHKNLTSSNVLLDGDLRAKITNFGLARSLVHGSGNGDNGDGLLHLTMHVVGTQGYLAPEFLENGLVTPKLDVFAFGMIQAELLSGRVVSATSAPKENGTGASAGDEADSKNEVLSASSIRRVFEGRNEREKLRSFVDGALGYEYPLDLAYSMAQLAKSCVESDLNSRPSMAEALMALSKILSSSLDWDPLDEVDRTSSINLEGEIDHIHQ